ncbi:MAG: hypothetical protein VCF25_01675 [Candidatus Poribacteria bacterium]|jgi:hypothetical protein
MSQKAGFTSKAPQRASAITLDQQLEQLKTDTNTTFRLVTPEAVC